jgi:hypothetical protein
MLLKWLDRSLKRAAVEQGVCTIEHLHFPEHVDAGSSHRGSSMVPPCQGNPSARDPSNVESHRRIPSHRPFVLIHLTLLGPSWTTIVAAALTKSQWTCYLLHVEILTVEWCNLAAVPRCYYTCRLQRHPSAQGPPLWVFAEQELSHTIAIAIHCSV